MWGKGAFPFFRGSKGHDCVPINSIYSLRTSLNSGLPVLDTLLCLAAWRKAGWKSVTAWLRRSYKSILYHSLKCGLPRLGQHNSGRWLTVAIHWVLFHQHTLISLSTLRTVQDNVFCQETLNRLVPITWHWHAVFSEWMESKMLHSLLSLGFVRLPNSMLCSKQS